MRNPRLIALAILLLGPQALLAEDVTPTAAVTVAPAPAATPVPLTEGFRMSGVVFGDYYDVPAHHTGRLENLNGTLLRRVWLTADKDLGQGFSARLRMEFASASATAASATMVPALKDAWISWAYAPKQKATLGLIDSGAVGYLEKQWGLRSVEKTPLDLQAWVVTREQGLSLEGDLGAFSYTAVYGNGDNNSSQGLDNGKKGLLAFALRLPEGVNAWVAGDLKAASDGVASPDPYTYTLQAFLGWKSAPARAGLLYARQTAVRPSFGDEKSRELVSAFVVAKVWGKASAFARMDHLLWNTVDVGGQAYLDLAKQRSTLSIVGLDYPITPNLNLQPNVEVAYYQDDNGAAVASQDVIPRLTFYWQF